MKYSIGILLSAILALSLSACGDPFTDLVVGGKHAAKVAKKVRDIPGVESAEFSFSSLELDSRLHGHVDFEMMPAQQWAKTLEEVRVTAHDATHIPSAIEARMGKVSLTIYTDKPEYKYEDYTNFFVTVSQELDASVEARLFSEIGCTDPVLIETPKTWADAAHSVLLSEQSELCEDYTLSFTELGGYLKFEPPGAKVVSSVTEVLGKIGKPETLGSITFYSKQQDYIHMSFERPENSGLKATDPEMLEPIVKLVKAAMTVAPEGHFGVNDTNEYNDTYEFRWTESGQNVTASDGSRDTLSEVEMTPTHLAYLDALTSVTG